MRGRLWLRAPISRGGARERATSNISPPLRRSVCLFSRELEVFVYSEGIRSGNGRLTSSAEQLVRTGIGLENLIVELLK